MHVEIFDILRCPFCGARPDLLESVFHRRAGDEIHDGVLQCRCCRFPVVAGIPVIHLEGPVPAALRHMEGGRPELARRAMFDLDGERADRFEEIAAAATASYAEVVDALGPNYERGYFLYRFSDPSYVVAHALVRSIAGTALRQGGRAIDLCGGSGHLTRAMMDLSSKPPILADLWFAKVWLGRQFTAPGCEAVCCHAEAPMPFRRGAFKYAMCADAFMFIWTKRRLVQELLRLVDLDHDVLRPPFDVRRSADPERPTRNAERRTENGEPAGAVVISHAHNQLQWSESLGQALPPDGYRDLFETIEPRMFSEAALFADVVNGGPLDLARRDSTEALEADPALTMVATRNLDVFKPHPLDQVSGAPGEIRLNPLYVVDQRGERVQLRLQFPSSEYEEEFGACREYLPEVVELEHAAFAAIIEGRLPPELADLARRRVILDLPTRYY
jgi:uncharacterized protein YbaR (Trm112 family)